MNKIGDYENIGDFIKDALKVSADDAPEENKVASETETIDQEKDEQFEASLEKVAKFVDALAELDLSKEADAKAILKGLKTLFHSPAFWAPATAIAGGAGIAVGKKMHKGKAEARMYDVAQKWYNLGAEEAATAISDMLSQQYFEPPVGAAGTALKKVSSYIRSTDKDLQMYRKREEATKIAQAMVEKGLIPEKQIFEKIAELEKDENLEVTEKAVEMASTGSVDFGKIAKDEGSSYASKGGMYAVLQNV